MKRLIFPFLFVLCFPGYLWGQSIMGDGMIGGMSSAQILALLGYTPENVANKNTTGSLGTSDTYYPSQKAVKTYADTKIAGPGVVITGYIVTYQGTTGLAVSTGINPATYMPAVDPTGKGLYLLRANTGGTGYELVNSISGLTWTGDTASKGACFDGSKNLVACTNLTDLAFSSYAPLNSPTLVTPVIGAATGTSLALTGPLTGAIPIKYVAAGAYTVGTTNSYEAYGAIIMVQNTGTIDTGVWALGKNFCTYSEGAYVVRVNPNGAEYIRLNGTLQASGVDIYSAGAAGDYICLIANTTNVWTTLGRSGTWTQGSSFGDGVGLFLLIGIFIGTLRIGWKLGMGRKEKRI